MTTTPATRPMISPMGPPPEPPVEGGSTRAKSPSWPGLVEYSDGGTWVVGVGFHDVPS